MITKTPVAKTINKNRFEVCVAFEHGDADATTYESKVLAGQTDEEFEDWHKRFKSIEKQINNMRWYSQDFDRAAAEKSLGMSLEDDHIYSGDSNYVAAISISHINWYDNSDNRYHVSVTQSE